MDIWIHYALLALVLAKFTVHVHAQDQNNHQMADSDTVDTARESLIPALYIYIYELVGT